jgi:hypothetical protein
MRGTACAADKDQRYAQAACPREAPDHGVRELVCAGQGRAQQPSPEPLLSPRRPQASTAKQADGTLGPLRGKVGESVLDFPPDPAQCDAEHRRASGGRWLVHPGLLRCRARLDRPLVAVECQRVRGRRLPWVVYVQIGSHGLHHLIPRVSES